ncbi:MAG: hypothetical protein EPO24_10620, partial [Bacteroidetes bacterium]
MKRRTAHLVCIFALLLAEVSFAYAQAEQGDRLAIPPDNEASVGFDKLLNRYHWITRLRYGATVGSISLFANQKFLSSLIKTDREFIRDEHFLDVALKHPFSSSAKGVLQASSYALSDDQNVALAKAGSHSIQYGVEFVPVERLMLTPMLGIRYDNQLGEHDNGILYRALVASSGLEIGGYEVALNGVNELAYLAPRRVETIRDTIGFQKTFVEGSRMNFTFSYLHNRRDFYLGNAQPVSLQYNLPPDIETRTESGFMFNGGVTYASGRTWSFLVLGALSSRDIGRNISYQSALQAQPAALSPNIEEFRLEGNAMATYSPNSIFSLSGGLSLFEREEQHGVLYDEASSEASYDSATSNQERKNNRATRTALVLDGSYIPSNSDTFKVSLSNSLLRYDTPNLLNDDDRDELRHTIRLTSFHRINPYLHAAIIAEASLAHLVYLAGARSSENTWNRIIRLSPALRYEPSTRFMTMNTFEVLANYTVYDFEYLSSTIRSFTFRQFAWIDSSIVTLTRRLSLEWYSNIRFY